MSNTVDLHVDGDSIDIEIERLSQLEEIIWGSKAPDSLKNGDPADITVNEEFINFLIDLTLSQTILTRELLEELPQQELTRLFNAAVAYAFGADVDIPERDEEIEWDDGSLDIGDL